MPNVPPRAVPFRSLRLVAAASLAIAAATFAGCGGSPQAAAPKDKPAVALEFGPGDLTRVSMRPIERSLAVSGSLIAVNQAVVKAKVAVEIRQVLVREGEHVDRGPGHRAARHRRPRRRASTR